MAGGGYSDGAVIIDTGLDNSGFARDAREFKGAVESLRSTVDKVGRDMSSSTDAYIRSIRTARADTQGLADAQKTLEREIARTEAAIASRQEKMAMQRRRWEEGQQAAAERAAEKFGELNNGAELMPWEDASTAMEQFARDQQAAIDAALEKYGEFEDSAQFRNLSADLDFLNEKLAALRDNLAEVQQAEGTATTDASPAAQSASGSFKAFGEVVGNAARGIARIAGQALHASANLAKMIGHGVLSFLAKLAEGAKNAAIQLAKLSGRVISKGLSLIGSAALRTGKALFGLERNTRSSNDGFKSGLKTILKYGFGVRSLFFLFRKLKATVKEGFETLGKYDPKVKAAVTSITTAFNGLKGSFSGSFAPILTAVAPALTMFINLVSKALNAVGMFMAALTGQDYYMAAKGVEAIGDSASSASGNVKELKRQLAGFDQLNILSAQSSSGSGGGSSSSSSGYGFEKTSISGGIADFVAKLKNLFANGEYEAIGQTIAGGINTALQKVQDWISWDNIIGPTVTNLVTSVTGMINGLVEGLDWTGIGNTLGDGVNTAVNTMALWFDGIDWNNLGTKLSDGLNGLVSRVNWVNLGSLFGQKINATLDVLYSAVSGFNWSEAGTAFAQAVNGLLTTVKWSTLSRAFGSSINGVVDALTAAVSTFDWGEAGKTFASNVNLLLTTVKWSTLTKAFGSSINGVVEALTAAVSTFDWGEAGKTFASNVNLLLTTVKWSALGKAIGSSIDGVLDWLYDAVSTFDWGEAGKTFAATVNGLLTTVKWSTLAKALGNSINGVVDALTDAVSDFSWGEAGKTFATNVNLLLTTVKWSTLGKALGSSINGVLDWLYDAVSTFDWGESGKTFAATVNGLLTTVKWSTLTKAFSNSINGVVGSLTEAVSDFSWGEAGKTFASNVNLLLTTVNWSTLGKAIGSSINGVLDWLHDAVSTFDWGDAGKKFASLVSSLVSEVKWGELGETIGNMLKGALAFMKYAIKTFDWIGFGEKIKEALLAIDWKGIGEEALKLFLSGWEGAIDLLISTLFGEDFAREYKANRDSIEPELTKTKDKLKSDPASVVKDLVENKNDIDVPRSLLGAFFGSGDEPVKVYKISDRKSLFDWLIPSASAEEGSGAMGKATQNAFETFFNGTSDNTNALDTNGRKLTSAAQKLFGALNENTEATEEYTYDPTKDPFSASYNGPTSDIDVDWNFGSPSVSVGVDFQANGASGPNYKNNGLINYLKKVFAPGTDTQTRVALVKNWVGTPLSALGLVGLVTDVLAKLAGKAEGSKSFAAIFGTVTDVLGKLTGKDSGSKTFATIFGTVTSVLGKLTGKDSGSKSFATIFGTVTSVHAKLTGKDEKSKTFAAVLGSVTSVLARLTGKDEKSKTFGAVLGTVASVLAKLTGKDKDSKTFGAVFGTLTSVLAKLTGNDKDSKTLGAVLGTVTSVLAKLTGKDKDSFSLSSLFGTVLDILANLIPGWTKGANGWADGALSSLSLKGLSTSAGVGIFQDWLGYALDYLGLTGMATGVSTGLEKNWIGTAISWLGLDGLYTTVKAGLEIEKGKSKIVLSTDAHDKNTWTVAVQAKGGIISAGGIARAFAAGGRISAGGRAGWWNSIPKYASGTRRAHGTMFVAGEAGPEIMGHINGRTEILNRSQLAQTMYGAVAGGMMAALRGLQFRMPAMATGSVMPYSVSEQIARSASELQGTLDANNEDLIQTIISVAGQIVAAVNGLQARQPQGVNGPSAQQLINEINRRTQMFSVSPLKGV